ncbi:MAG TPA: alpha/beta hydrolase-fold protein [Candidatus Acidoferrum sp.]
MFWKRFLPIAGVAVLSGVSGICAAQTPTDKAADIEEVSLASKVFHNTRTLRVLLPPHYHDPASRSQKYPVFYFTDGIAVFHGRQLDHIASNLMRTGKIPPMIFVGIDNGGSTRESRNPGTDRASEYLPFEDKFLEPPLPNPQGRLFPQFLEDEVRPAIDGKYRTTKEAGLGGASYGAEIALYTAMERPGHYRWLYLESPSLYVHDDALLHRAQDFHQWPTHIYIGAGTAEGSGGTGQEMVDDVTRLYKIIEHQTQSCLLIAPGAHHEEEAWRARLPYALDVLLGNASCYRKRDYTTDLWPLRSRYYL